MVRCMFSLHSTAVLVKPKDAAGCSSFFAKKEKPAGRAVFITPALPLLPAWVSPERGRDEYCPTAGFSFFAKNELHPAASFGLTSTAVECKLNMHRTIRQLG